jgi:hypothetical protein
MEKARWRMKGLAEWVRLQNAPDSLSGDAEEIPDFLFSLALDCTVPNCVFASTSARYHGTDSFTVGRRLQADDSLAPVRASNSSVVQRPISHILILISF